MTTMDLNCDLGERDDLAAIQPDLLASITSANVACGGHAGSDALMRLTVAQALRHGVALGAHPGYPDRVNFGRVALDLPSAELESSIESQLRALACIAAAAGACLTYVKPHGALYNRAARDPNLAATIARAVARVLPHCALMGLAGSSMLDVWRDSGFAVIAEAFADRLYDPDGTLRARHHADALLTANDAAAQALRLARHGEIVARDLSVLKVDAQSLCIHSDTPGAPALARAVRAALEQAGVRVAPWHAHPFSS